MDNNCNTKYMLFNFIENVKKYKKDIILFIIVILLLLLSFAAGFIVAKYQDKEPIQFTENQKI